MKTLLTDYIDEYNNRKGRKQENLLFINLDYAIRDENFSATKGYRMNDAETRYKSVKKILQNTKEDVIESNIYLKSCREYLRMVSDDCVDLLMEHEATGENKLSKNITGKISFDFMEVKNLNSIKDVATYNKIQTELKGMYEEIARLTMWHLIKECENEKSAENNLAVIYLKKENDDTIMHTLFLDKKVDSNKHYVNKSNK